jgi:hypothetical protein
MALPTLIGNDGRAAVIAFTSSETLSSWRQDARPVPVAAARLWAAALTEADAVVVDIAGPVPLVVEGARLRKLAAGEPPPPAHEDPDIRAAIAEVIADFTLEPGGPDADLTIGLKATDPVGTRALVDQLATRLRPRLRRVQVRIAELRGRWADHPRVHRWLVPPLQVQRSTSVPLAVPWPSTSRQRPDSSLVMLPSGWTCHSWLPPPLQV